ncbi:MAG: ATP-binding protein, partial [Promethearchaeota archaeon]
TLAKKVKISNTMKRDSSTFQELAGCWHPKLDSIIIKRNELSEVHSYAGTLIHEAIHAIYGYDDVSYDFENTLTYFIGRLLEKLVGS